VPGEIQRIRADLGVLAALGDELEDLVLPDGESVDRGDGSPSDRVQPELGEVGEHDVEHGRSHSSKSASSRSNSIHVGASRVEPEAHHVLDCEGSTGLLVNPESVVLALGEEVGVLPRAVVPGNLVAYRVLVSGGFRTWTKAGRTTSGTVALSLVCVRPNLRDVCGSRSLPRIPWRMRPESRAG
jgi:hypothetical protein